MRFHSFIFCLAFIGFFSLSFPQVTYNHPELNWQTFETDHFMIHFYDGTEHSAREGAVVAENIYPFVTDLYDYAPPVKTHIIFTDTDDIANGAAYYYDNKIIIWTMPLDFELRGSHRWLQNVITHEFTHIVSMQKAMKAGLKYPGAYLQYMGYEDEKRQDVLYGFPNTLVSYPLPGTAVPPWLAEGTAQFMYEGADYDNWDTHRDMILRDRVLYDNLLTLTEMNTFGKSGIGNESTYNSGYALCRYIAVKYGPEKLKMIMEELSHPFQYSIDNATEKATGLPGKELYNNYKDVLEKRYDLLTATMRENEQKGNILISEGTANLHPVWSPDGKRFAYISNKNNDYFGQTDLFIYTIDTKEEEKISGGVKSAPSWHPD
ncbi:MAG: biopolymer transporter Tol, partial [Candidatus Marinimicrobia bacterium]|nr:biopolymer transporter Tol [Candidatus Neomarinimicrobiota bacterium]